MVLLEKVEKVLDSAPTESTFKESAIREVVIREWAIKVEVWVKQRRHFPRLSTAIKW